MLTQAPGMGLASFCMREDRCKNQSRTYSSTCHIFDACDAIDDCISYVFLSLLFQPLHRYEKRNALVLGVSCRVG